MAEQVRVKLRHPLVNVGKFEGGKYNPQNNTTTFFGEMKVDSAMAEDLERRADEWQKHQDLLHRDNGTRDMEAGSISGNQA